MRLPPLPPAFRWSTEPWGAALVCEPLLAVAPHLFTTRVLTLRVGAGAGSPRDEGWESLAASMDLPEPSVLRLRQVHGREVVVVHAGKPLPPVVPAPEADAFATDHASCALAVRGADCVPLLLADRRIGAVAAAHAGWRGTVAGTGVAALHAMAQAFGSRPADVVVALGPGIGPCCYEVGTSVVEACEAAGHGSEARGRWFTRNNGLRFDLWTANVDQLVRAGVPAGQVHASRLCTACHPEVLFSYRREGEGIGRLAGVIRVRKAGRVAPLFT
ncbi:MAG: peptidoglycan editing factor PgeF [Vicinamibacterales bacterium]